MFIAALHWWRRSPLAKVLRITPALMFMILPLLSHAFLSQLFPFLYSLPLHWYFVFCTVQFSSVQSLSRVWLFATPWTAVCQASLSITSSRCLLTLLSIESVMPSNHPSSVVPFSSCLQSFPESGSFPMSQFFASGGQSIRVSASLSVLPMNTQDWSPLGWTGWISLQSKGLARVFSNTTVQKHQLFSTQLSL